METVSQLHIGLGDFLIQVQCHNGEFLIFSTVFRFVDKYSLFYEPSLKYVTCSIILLSETIGLHGLHRYSIIGGLLRLSCNRVLGVQDLDSAMYLCQNMAFADLFKFQLLTYYQLHVLLLLVPGFGRCGNLDGHNIFCT